MDLTLHIRLFKGKPNSISEDELKFLSISCQYCSDINDRDDQYFDPIQYYSNKSTNLQKLYDELKPHQPLKFVYKPINRHERVKSRARRLKKYDIHWRNIELLRQFMSQYGNIKSRFANSLLSIDQKRVTKAIKTARHNCAIPYTGKFLTPNKRNITNI